MHPPCHLIATTGRHLARTPLHRNFKEALTHLPLSTDLAAPAYCMMVVLISDPLSTVAVEELRRSPPRSRMASLALMAIRLTRAHRTLDSLLHCASHRATAPLGRASKGSCKSLMLTSPSCRNITSTARRSFMHLPGRSATVGNL